MAILVDKANGYPPSLSRGRESALSSLTIPERFRGGLAAIGSLSDDSYTSLLRALKTAGPADNAKALAAGIAVSLSSITRLELEKMISALATTQEVKRNAHVEAKKFASDAWRALIEDSPKLMKGIDQSTFKARLATLIDETDVHLTAIRIGGLRSESERIFCGVRIMTDIRTAFEDDATKPPPGATILHTLEVKYHDDLGRHREFYVTLDDDDLATLKAAVERAETKRKTLESLLKKADLKVFD